jgi:predicted dienelactone hydrolase
MERKVISGASRRNRNEIALTAILLGVLAIAAVPVRAATDPGANGSFTAGKQTISIPATQGSVLTTDVHYPKSAAGGVDPAAGLCPVIVFGHGFSRSKEQYVNVGSHLATRGFITIIPNFSGSDHGRNADDLIAMIDWILARNADPGSIFNGRIDAAAIGSSGHSAGGLSAILAASRDARIRATAPRDPVDSNSLGVNALASVHIPVAITYSEDSSCNANGSARALYAAALSPKRGVKIVGGTHCDPEDPTNFLCTLVCGSAASARQTLYRKYTTGWFEYYLRCDSS